MKSLTNPARPREIAGKVKCFQRKNRGKVANSAPYGRVRVHLHKEPAEAKGLRPQKQIQDYDLTLADLQELKEAKIHYQERLQKQRAVSICSAAEVGHSIWKIPRTAILDSNFGNVSVHCFTVPLYIALRLHILASVQWMSASNPKHRSPPQV